MKKFSLLLFITGAAILSLMGLVANAAPTSTILLIPKIPGLASTGNPCLTVGDSSTLGLVATSTCGSGASSSTFARAATKVVCASNAIDTTNCDYIATGTADDVIIQTAINAVSSSAPGFGVVQLSEGTFNVSSTIINNKNDIWIKGMGRGATLINMSSGNTTYGFHLGNAQVSSANTIVHISDMTITANNTSTVPLWLDGMGQGSDVANIKTNSGLYGVIFEDADRVTAENVEANNAFTAQIVLRQGIVNTFGKFSLTNVRATIGYASSSGWLFDADTDQGSPNALSAITIINSFAFGSTIASTTCFNFAKPVTGLSVISTEAENCTTQVNISGEVDGSWIDSDFLNTPTSSQNIFYINAFSNLTFLSNNFQQAINAFNGVSGFPKLTFLGQNRNAGNITNVFTGSYNVKLGTDNAFTGDNTLDAGLSAKRIANVYANNLVASSTNTANLTVTGVTSSLGLLGSGGLLSPFLGSNCSGGQAANGVSATGTVTGCFTPAGSGSATATIAVAGFTFSSPFTFATTTGISISSSSGNITFGNTGVTSANGATGAVNVVNTVNGSTGTILFYATSPLSMATGTASTTFSCPTCLTGNQSITLTGAVTGSGATTIATTYTTSTLFAFFSATSPITFNTSTAVIACPTCGTGNGTVTTSSAVTVNQFPFWVTAGGQLSGTSTLTNLSGNLNATGTLTISSGTYVGGLLNVTSTSNLQATTTVGVIQANGAQFTTNPTTFKSYVITGSSTVASTIGGTMAYSATSTGNGAGASTSIATYNIPTSTYLTIGDEVDVFYGGTIANTAATNKQIQVVVASTTVFDTGATFSPANTACNWFAESRGMANATIPTTATATTTFMWVTQFTDSCTSALTDDSGDAGNKSVTATTTSPINITVYGNGTNANDTVLNYFRIIYAPF